MITTQNSVEAFDIDPILAKLSKEAREEHSKLQKVFEIMGWGDLPDVLKIEIESDVMAMVDELEGQYSTCDPFVLKRRERVIYWVESYHDGICSLQTAVDALKIRGI